MDDEERPVTLKRPKNRRVTPLIEIELNRYELEDEAYRVQQAEMFEYFKELKIANALYKNRWKALAVTGGPIWYEELSVVQREALDELKLNMHMDVGQGTPFRTVATFATLGILPNYSPTEVMKALGRTDEDPIRFISEIYMMKYESEPTTPLRKYKLEQKLLLSAMVHLELNQLIDDLNAAIPCSLSKHSIVKPKARHMTYKKINPYLMKPMYTPLVKSKMYTPPVAPKPAPPLCNSFINMFGLYSADNIYENARSKVQKPEKERHTESSVADGAVDSAKDEASAVESTVQENPANPCNISCGCVRWFSGIIRYLVKKREKEELEMQEALRVAEEQRMARMLALRKKNAKQSKKQKDDDEITGVEGKSLNKGKQKEEESIYPPQTKKYPISVKEFIKTVMAKIPEEKYYILKLPDVLKLPKIQEWGRFRVNGGVPHEEKMKTILKAGRKWQILVTQDLKIKTPALPYPKEDLFTMTWDRRDELKRHSTRLRDAYYKQTKRALIQIGQVWWSTMDAEKFHNKHFRNVFFSYLPAREMDVTMI